MKFKLSISLLLFLCTFKFSIAQTICSNDGNLMIYSNYDGGIVNINVDANIPNLYIGICTYEPVQVSLSGPFLGNVVGVIYAGFASTQGNNNCGLGDFPTVITGVDASLIDINVYPPVGLDNPNGWPNMVGVAGACSATQNAGGGNTPDQVVYYFQQLTGATLYAHFTQYNCWLNTSYNVSQGGNCCVQPNVACIPPQVDAGNSLSICPGQSATLGGSPTASGGSGNYTYTWFPATGLNDASIANPIATPATSTTYTLTVDAGENCSSTATVNVNVEAEPTLQVSFNAPDLSLCAGESVTLSAQSGFSNYVWSNGVNGQSITVSSTTQLSVSATAGAGCSATSETLNITVDPIFSIGILPEGPHNICGDSSIVLTAQAGFSNYVWSNNFQGNAITVNQTGGYSVSAQNANGCSGSSDVVQVNSNPLPIAAFSYEQLNETNFTVQFTSTAQNTGAWFWDFGSGNTSDQPNPSFDFLFDDVWPVTLIASNVCGSDTVTVDVDVIKTSINDPILRAIQCIRTPNGILLSGTHSKPEPLYVAVYSLSGQLIASQELSMLGSWNATLRIPENIHICLLQLRTSTAQRSIRIAYQP